MIGNMTYGSNAISRDLGEVIYRMKMLGFNAIRLPFTFAGLAEARAHAPPALPACRMPVLACPGTHPRHPQAPVSYTEQCSVPADADIMATVVPPSVPSGLKASGLTEPPQTPPEVPGDLCNKYLPNDSTEDRYIWVLRYGHPSGSHAARPAAAAAAHRLPAAQTGTLRARASTWWWTTRAWQAAP